MESPSAFAVRRMEPGAKYALSSSTVRVESRTSVLAPPITPATATARAASAITSIVSPSGRLCPSSVTTVSPGRARRTTTWRPARRSPSNACSGWPSSQST